MWLDLFTILIHVYNYYMPYSLGGLDAVEVVVCVVDYISLKNQRI